MEILENDVMSFFGDVSKTGGPAFPFEFRDDGNPSVSSPGMTLRDWFAGQAITNLSGDVNDTEGLAREAYKIADALLKEREKNEDGARP